MGYIVKDNVNCLHEEREMKMESEGKGKSDQNTTNIATDNRSTKWKQIGLWVGIVPGVLLMLIFPKGLLVLLFLIGSDVGIPFGLTGAYIGRRSEKAAWLGAILGIVVGIGAFVWFLTATCILCQ